MMKNRKMTLAIFILLTSVHILSSQGNDNGEKSHKEKVSMNIPEWLVCGPASLPLPVVAGEGAEFTVSNLLDLDALDPLQLWVKEGESFKWSPDQTLVWKASKAEDGKIAFKPEIKSPHSAFFACYLESARWQKIQLEIESHHLLKIYLDGVEISAKKTSSPKDSEKPEKISKEAPLSQGTHRLFITAVYNPEGPADWTVRTQVSLEKKEDLGFTLTPRRAISEDDIQNARAVSSLSMSRDGQAVAWTLSKRNPRTEKSERWIEIHKLPSGELERVLRDSQGLRDLQWSPDGKWLSAIAPGEKETSDLWLIERATGNVRILLDDIKLLGGASWSPTGDFLVYTVTEEPKEKDPKVEYLKGLEDRWTRNTPYKTHLYLVMTDSGICRRLTAGTISSSAMFSSTRNAISPDGKKLLFLRSQPDYQNRPYSRTEIFVLDLGSQESKKLFTSYHSLSSVSWSPNGRNICFVGGQSIAMQGGKTGYRNDYDQDFYILDSETKEIRCLTQSFAPSVSSASWTSDGSIFFSVTDGSRGAIYKTREDGREITRLETGADAAMGFDVSKDGSRIIYAGTSSQVPSQVFVMDRTQSGAKILFTPDRERWENVVFGKVEDFELKNGRGDRIEGWIYYPLNFDPGKKYPLIVHYYGGTAPTARYFNTQLLQYAANGYAVYVLNPSGATGYGPQFSDFHVNDWGKIVADEIISSVKKVLESKPFLDATRIGAFGGSYGGFMTETLAYKTDLFRCLISLYGISNITSYWGEGWWGFLYSGVATAGSFPWNRPDIYVDRSPIFHADKIKTPLLLLHGLADINVPITESEQLFTALKMLGRDVEYIRFKGEDHGISGTDENRRLVPRIMLAWWDKYLKNQPEAWEVLGEKKR